MRDALTFYARTFREGAVMLAVFPMMWLVALALEIAR